MTTGRISTKPEVKSKITLMMYQRLDEIESSIFVILFVLCFQRQSFLTLIVQTRFIKTASARDFIGKESCNHVSFSITNQYSAKKDGNYRTH